MTTTVNVEAAGHNIIIFKTHEIEGEESYTIEFVPKGSKATFYVHQTADISVSEVRDNETELNALIDAGDIEGARAYAEAAAAYDST